MTSYSDNEIATEIKVAYILSDDIC